MSTLERLRGWFGRFACATDNHSCPLGAATFDGCSFESRCARCGKRCQMDSQGNWFATSHQPLRLLKGRAAHAD